MSFQYASFPHLETVRLYLRQLTKLDAPTIYYLRTDPVVNKFIYRPNPHKNVQEAEAFIEKTNNGMEQGKNINWGITLKPDAQLIGTVCLWNFTKDGLHVEVGYDLHPQYQSMGIMSEVMPVVLQYGFEKLNVQMIDAYTHHANEPSIKLLLKNHFQLNDSKRDDENVDNRIFELTNTEYRKAQLD